MMHSETIWILVANSTRAKIFKVVHFPKIEEIAMIEHPESRLLAQDLVSSAPGRNFQRGGVTRHAYETKSDPKDMEMENFAKIISKHLSEAFQAGKFSRLHLMANPSFLGMLRQHIDPKVHAAIVSELAKDMTELHQAEIEHQLSNMQF